MSLKNMFAKCLENASDDEEGPGPAAYPIKTTIGIPKTTDPTHWQSPAYSLRPMVKMPNYDSSPGPVYKVDRTTRHGRETSAKMIVGNLLGKRNNAASPGPAAYLPCYPYLKRAPTPKILFPLAECMPKSVGPAPNAYTLRKADVVEPSVVYSRIKGYTIKWRTNYGSWEPGALGPGPAAYDPVNVDVYKKREPTPQTFGKSHETKVTNVTPGSAEEPRHQYTSAAGTCAKSCRSKGFTFGVKHSRKCNPYVVPADNAPPP